MAFRIVKKDITKVKADAIVNTASSEPTYTEGTDRAIYEAAGVDYLLAERARIGRLNVGQAAPTPAFALPARYVIHTVGPVWTDGTNGELEDLRRCYENSLEVAAELNCSSVAVPLIATEAYGFPKPEALKIAVSEIAEFLKEHDMKITLVVLDSEDFVLSGNVFSEVGDYVNKRMLENKGHEDASAEKAGKPAESPVPAEVKSWADTILWWIREKGYTDVEVYKRANVEKQLFDKIKNKEEYQPKKTTVVAFAMALRLNPDESRDLLKKAGFKLSLSNKFDLIIDYFLDHGIYDTYDVNLTLFDHKQPLLGE